MWNRTACRFILCAVTLAATVPAVGRGWKTPPDLETDHLPRLCEQFDSSPDSKFRLPHPGAENWPVYRFVQEGIEFRIALDPGTQRVRALSTKDLKFRTPEDVGLGSTLKEVRQKSDEKLQCEAGWTCFLALPSGWIVGFSTVHMDPETNKMEYRDPQADSTVNSLLLRGECDES
jgi:hypothetical protein